MKRPAFRLVLALLALFTCRSAHAQEIRAFWADAFNPAIKSPEEIQTLIRRLHEAHCNAIFAQVRKGGDAYYLSRYEPWASDDRQHFDGLAYLIEQAHKARPRIAVHAWINTCAVGKTMGNPHHIAAAHPEWLSLSDTGENYDGEATKIDPGNPDAADWTFRVYLDIVRHYAVDGIHFDFVRYGSTDGKGRFGYNPVSVARFNALHRRAGKPEWTDPAWKQWRRDQVTALVRKVYAMAAAINPKIQVSAATIAWSDGPRTYEEWVEKSAPMNRVFQDWVSWMEEGILDLNCTMTYFNEAKHPDFFRTWTDWAKDHQYRRWAVPSSGIWLNPIPDSFKQIEQLRAPTAKANRAHGILLYSYGGTNAGPDGKEVNYNEEFYTALSHPSPYASKPPFESPSEYPKLPWKEAPRLGHLQGFVLTHDDLTPVDGAAVSIGGKKRSKSTTTDGTGFYAGIDLPPGDYLVKVQRPGSRGEESQRATIRAGQVTTLNFFLGASMTPLYDSFESAWKLPTNSPVGFSRLEVVGGTDTFPNTLFVRTEDRTPTFRVHLAAPPLVPFQPGDVVAVQGTWTTLDGEVAVDNAVARLVGMHRYTEQWVAVARELIAQRGLPAAAPVMRIYGKVTDSKPDRIIVDTGAPIEVMLAGRKDPGVESPVEAIPAPAVGSQVEVTGINPYTRPVDGKPLYRLYPRTAEEVKPMPAPLKDTLLTLAKWLTPISFRGPDGLALAAHADGRKTPRP